METPEDTSREGVSRQVVDFIHDKFPNKPVRYAVPTHHHVDHVGGARDYVATGATIISTKANEKVIRQLAAQRSTITPDTLDKANLPLKLQFIGESPLKFSDQEQELQVFAIGPTPHVKEILIGYLPKQKILFQTDLFNAWSCFKQQVPNESIGHTTALGDTQALIAAVERLGLEVDRVIGGHGLDVEYTWMKEFTQRRAKDGLPMWACTADEMREAFGATH
jgi:flavorubredoxin